MDNAEIAELGARIAIHAGICRKLRNGGRFLDLNRSSKLPPLYIEIGAEQARGRNQAKNELHHLSISSQSAVGNGSTRTKCSSVTVPRPQKQRCGKPVPVARRQISTV